jgi:hypothetical protein
MKMFTKIKNFNPRISFRKRVSGTKEDMKQMELFPFSSKDITYPKYVQEMRRLPLMEFLDYIGLSQEEAKKLLLNYAEVEDRWIKMLFDTYREVTNVKS